VQLPVFISRALGAGLVLAVLAPAAAQAHDTRYTSPAATATASTCPQAMPCTIDYAVNGASDGDEVVVGPGTYAVTTPLDAKDIVLRGGASPAPQLIGDTNLPGDLLTFAKGGTLRHLSLRSDSPGHAALELEKAVAEDLVISAVTGDGAHVLTNDTTTVLRDSVVVAEDTGANGDGIVVIDGSGGSAEAALRNVTALADADAAIRCQASDVVTLVNVIARGGTEDVDATAGTGCTASYSNLRPAFSPLLPVDVTNQAGDPKLMADQRPKADSPTVDAGAADALTSSADPDGIARTVPDIGAYEAVAATDDDQGENDDDQGEDEDGQPKPTTTTPAPTASTPSPSVNPPVRGVPAPVLGETVVVAPGRGNVLVRRPGTRRFRRLSRAALLPSGSVVDARRGRILLTTALDEAGEFQTGRFWGSRFQVRQSASGNGMTSLALRGGDFGRCPARSSALAHTSVVPRENPTTRRVVRRLWARDRGGRFRTYGNNSVATARGTAWVTKDRCDGTVTRVREGAVAIKNRRTGKTVIVRAGGSYLARR
jgi:hypothetical protein